MEEITLKEFDAKYSQPEKEWRFDLFKIACTKCGSDKIEYNGKMETENGYYGEVTVHSLLVVKCHGCGNAFAMKTSDSGYGDYCGSCEH